MGTPRRTGIAAAAAIPVLLAEQFANGAIDVFLHRGFDEVLAPAGRGIRHALAELVVGHLAEGDRALGEALAVAAVCAGDVVGQLQRATRAGGRAFLPDRDVRRAAVVELADRIVGAGAELDDHLFEFTDDQHVLEDCDGFAGDDGPGFQFGFKASLVAIGGDFAAIDFERREFRPRIAQISR